MGWPHGGLEKYRWRYLAALIRLGYVSLWLAYYTLATARILIASASAAVRSQFCVVNLIWDSVLFQTTAT